MKTPVLLVALATMISVTLSANAADNALTKDDVRQIVKDFILENPDVIEEAFKRKQQKEFEDRQTKAKQNISKMQKELYKDPMSPVIGKGSKAVVYFFDYNCGYCKRTFPMIKDIVSNNKEAKIILKELPILGPTSEAAAKYAIAANKINKDKYFEFHGALMEFTGEKTEESLLEMAKKIGYDEKKIKETANSKDVAEHIERDRKLADAIGVNGTPAFVFGEELAPGAVDKATFEEKLKSIKK